jgi:hypothetical protein
MILEMFGEMFGEMLGDTELRFMLSFHTGETLSK